MEQSMFLIQESTFINWTQKKLNQYGIKLEVQGFFLLKYMTATSYCIFILHTEIFVNKYH
jgi:hypothetical protein